MAVKNYMLMLEEARDIEKLKEDEKRCRAELKALKVKLERKRELGEEISLEEINALMFLNNPDQLIIS